VAGIDAFSKTRKTRFIGLASAMVIGLIGSLAIIGTPAAAAVSGLIRVSSTSGSTPDSVKIITVDCPAGKQLVGTGARIDGGLGEAVLTALQPNGSLTVAPTRVMGMAVETDPIFGNRSLTVYGVCASPLPGLVRISAASSDQQSEDFKAVNAVCPEGKAMVGTGFLIGPGFGIGGVTVDRVYPLGFEFGDPVSFGVQVHAAETDAYTGNWNVTAYAICATQPAGLGVYRAVSADNSDNGRTATAQCPLDNRLLGTGVSFHGPSGQIVLDDFVPNGGPTTAPTSVRVTAYEEDPVAEDWIVAAYAICAHR
jgi:hypothetical protein